MRQVFILCCVFFGLSSVAQDRVTLSGEITDAINGEQLIGATIYIASLPAGASTNAYGFYSLTVPPGKYDVKISYIGYTTLVQQIILSSDTRLKFELSPADIQIGAAVIEVKSEAAKNVESVEMSKVRLSMESIKKIPAFMGEVDVIKAIQLLPGVQTVGEGTSGFYVRGGAVDQNLILLDEGPVYNASHLLGFFSVFNSDAIKDVQLYKGGIPARYGGRLSSVLDIRMNDGNDKNYCAQGGIGTISSRLAVEGPIVNDKSSFLITGRRTYADLFLKLSKNEAQRNTQLFFYDLNAKVNYELGENDRLYVSGYFGRDVFGFSDLFRFEWGNATSTVRWNHIFNNRLFSNLTFIYTDFDYKLGQSDSQFGLDWNSRIRDYAVKYDFNYFLNPENTIRFGAAVTLHDINPGSIVGTGADPLFNDLIIPSTRALEPAAYISNEQKLGDRFTAIYGVRLSGFVNMGPGEQWTYDSDFNPVDSTVYKAWDVYHSSFNLEPRVGMNFMLNETSSVKASYNRTAQYIQLASNSTSSSPLDVWFASTSNVKPQLADQVAFGYFRNFYEDQLEFSAEVYYKKMQNTIDFKDHASLFLNKHLEGQLRFGEARAYGLELMMRKQVGDLSGLVSYTLSRTERLIPDITADWYPTKYDKTHDISFLAAYKLSERWSFGLNYVYSTGAAVTMPTGRFEFMGAVVPVYSDRNGARMPAYHRMDVSATLQGKIKPQKRWKGEWVFSVYNVYNRHNAFAINFYQEDNDPNQTYAEKMYLLPIIPSVTYNFKFCK